MSKLLKLAQGCVVAVVVAGCGPHHQEQIKPIEGGTNLTVGTVQREIHIGMSGADVAQTLGSPNIVTTDDQRRETWIYDKIATEVRESHSSGFGFIVILGASGGSSASSTSQKTLTVVIKFDQDRKVRDFAYNTSRF